MADIDIDFGSFSTPPVTSLLSSDLFLAGRGAAGVNFTLETLFRNVPAGSTSAPGLAVGEGGTGLSRPAAGQLAISLLGGEVARFVGVNLGIGTTSPQAYLHIQSTTGLTPQIKLGGASGYQLQLGYNNSAEYGFFQAYAANLSTPDDIVLNPSGGNVGIGATAPVSKFHVNSAGATATFATVGNDYGGVQVGVNASGISTVAAYGATGILFGKNNASAFNEFGRFDPSGNWLVGTTTGPTPGTSGVKLGAIGYAEIGTTSSAAWDAISFINPNGTVGTIRTSGSTTSYNTSSDKRLKTNIVPAPDAGDWLDAIQIRSFDWKADGSRQTWGVIAQELDTIAPFAVSKGANDNAMWAVDYSKLVPGMIKELQSLRVRVGKIEGAA